MQLRREGPDMWRGPRTALLDYAVTHDYNGPAEASAIPPGWHAWMHYRAELPPTEERYVPRAWEKPHQPNLTGTAYAYRPKGSILGAPQRPLTDGEYDAWRPK